MYQPDTHVLFCGENPELSLVLPDDTETTIAVASYWKAAYSPHGDGNVLLLWMQTPHGKTRAIYTNNDPLAHFLADQFVQHFPSFAGVPLHDVETQQARFTCQSDGRTIYHVICQNTQQRVEVIWRDVLDYRLPTAHAMVGGSQGEKSLEVSNVICPVREGSILIKHTPVPGEVYSFHDGVKYRSTAFLAFSETWIEK